MRTKILTLALAVLLLGACKNGQGIKETEPIHQVEVTPIGYNINNVCFVNDENKLTDNSLSHIISSLTTQNCVYYFYDDIFLDSLYISKIDYNTNSCHVKAYSINILHELEKKSQLLIDSLYGWEKDNLPYSKINFDFQIFSGINFIGLIVSANHNQRDSSSDLLPKALVLFDTLLNLNNVNVIGPYPSIFYTYNGNHGTISISHSDTIFIQNIGELNNFVCITKNKILKDFQSVDTTNTLYFEFLDPYASKIVNGFVNDSFHTLQFKFSNKDIFVDLAKAIKRYKVNLDLYSLMHNGYIANNIFYSTFNVYDDEKKPNLENISNSHSFIIKIDMTKSLNPTPEFYKFSNIQIESLLPTLGGINFIYYKNQHSNNLKLGFLN